MFDSIQQRLALGHLSGDVRRVVQIALDVRASHHLGAWTDGAFHCYEVSSEIARRLGGGTVEGGVLPDLHTQIANHAWVRTMEGDILDATIGQFQAFGTDSPLLGQTRVRGVYYSHRGCDGELLSNMYEKRW